MNRFFFKSMILLFVVLTYSCSQPAKEPLDLSKSTILISPNIKLPMHETVVNVLTEEVAKRTGIELERGDNWDNTTIIALIIEGDSELYGRPVPARTGDKIPELKKEGYRIFHEN